MNPGPESVSPRPSASTPTSVRGTPPLWLLVMVTFSGTMAMHMFVPALPSAAIDLHATPAVVQMTISLYIFGLALGQLVYGPLADCFGRRPTLMAGLVIYTIASVVAALSHDVHLLIAARLAQALGGCAGLLIGRAVVRDTSNADDILRRLALIGLMSMIGPGLAPFVGATISADFSWRFIFVLLGAMGLFNLVSVWRLLPETGNPTRILNTRTVRSDYRSLLGSRRFVGFALGGGCATTAFYAFIASAPFTWAHDLHRPPREVGLYLGLLVVGISVGNLFSNRIRRGVSANRVMIGSAGLSVVCAFVLLALVLMHVLSAPLIGTVMFVYSIGLGMCSPAAMAKSLNVNPRVTGSAAGLYGFTQMAVGAICTSLTAIGTNLTVSAAVVMAVAGVLGLAAFAVGLADERKYHLLQQAPA